jgi:hypothetical protein
VADERRAAAYRRIGAALDGDTATDGRPGADPVSLVALADVRWLRAELDRAERDLIRNARETVGWQRIAGALGLASRQAAEQRYLRLVGPPRRDARAARVGRRRQRDADAAHGPQIALLRAAARRLAWSLAAVSNTDPVCDLARKTLLQADDAPPGGLYSLAAQALADLQRAAPPVPVDLEPLRAALRIGD